ncbi:UDP-glucose 6-dehydrogenase [Bacillus sp. FJAT-18017]|uniref:UDP-glucose dehydrogenase family protein n=1 Tax=Bacillus sp. FJAT-18017 TaxID=1705566 RepID=UPI0006AF29E7|nr:UDP-glucose/GDP-mannose dehydrogenase family protein [Bacillus sp. FJAT-18017]ALC91651.1 UDP-glucose 6-dehydrogenase [Bacillus sp. FJAT-18017]
MKITVAGTGYVGLVNGVCLAEMGYEVVCIDTDETKINTLQKGIPTIYEPGLEGLLKKNSKSGRLRFTLNPREAYSDADVIIIAVGTPENSDGSVNLEYIYSASYTIAAHMGKDAVICTRSTVPVGTNAQIEEIIARLKPPPLRAHVVSLPEFLREGSAIFDFFNGDRIIIGAANEEAADVIEGLFLPLNIPIAKTDRNSAEMIKYAANAFLATKISFINEIASLCEKVEADIDEVANGIGMDSRIGPHFLRAGIGYGGSCFPKDTKALLKLSGNMEQPFMLLQSVIEVNNKQHSLPVAKAKKAVGSLAGKKVAVLGLSYKPDTDDIRESASIRIIQELLDEGAKVIAYDPLAIPNAKRLFGDEIDYTLDIRQALSDAETAIIATDWDQIRHLQPSVFASYMKEPILIDGRNCFTPERMRLEPITYISIGRPALIRENPTIYFH